jgi:hypothetical protein
VTLPVVAWSMLMAGTAAASPGLAHRAAQQAAARAVPPGSPMIRPLGVTLSGPGAAVNTTETSPNWSGYVLLSNRSGAFRSVSASWIQPAARCSGVGNHRYASFWVGLDGASLPTGPADGTVEQTGTDSDCVGKVASYFGWYEMFPAAAVNVRAKVNPGDHMSASVMFLGPGRGYALVLRDLTRHWATTIVRHQAGLRRSSAEVITEAPALETSSGLHIQPLADFGTVRFTGARVNGLLLRTLAPVRVVLVDNSQLLQVSTSRISSADAFTNTWLRAR